ncbi:hypothetical protein [Arthrobacter sp. RAF14]|uniref:hypothetical protein n=1 Tax=Arthrobacter sp. RAF14 TaxID=3233051 RepID=UPI003F93BBDA
MTKSRNSSSSRPRRQAKQKPRIIVTGVPRERPDLRKLARAAIALAQAETEREAQAQHENGTGGASGAARDGEVPRD